MGKNQARFGHEDLAALFQLSGHTTVLDPTQSQFVVFEFFCFLQAEFEHNPQEFAVKWGDKLSIIVEISHILDETQLDSLDYCDHDYQYYDYY